MHKRLKALTHEWSCFRFAAFLSQLLYCPVFHKFYNLVYEIIVFFFSVKNHSIGFA